MDNIKFAISYNGDLTEEEREFLTLAYHNLFTRIYGPDVFDSLLQVTKTKLSKFEKKYSRVIKKYADNYMRAIDALKTVQENENFELLLIYSEKNILVGGGRLRKINENEASIPDLAIFGPSEESTREIWKEAVAFSEAHFANQGFDKMYVEIPLSDTHLLFRADDLGFKEFPEGIDPSRNRTYLLSKALERKDNVELNSGRK